MLIHCRTTQTQSIYVQRSGKGGLLTLLVALTIVALAWGEAREFLFGQHGYSFDVDHHIGQDMQINVDLTVAMKCHCEQEEGEGVAAGLLTLGAPCRPKHRRSRRCGRQAAHIRLRVHQGRHYL